MFKASFFVFVIFLTLKGQGQLAIIKDPDGFTNVREGKSISSKVVGRLYADDVFLYSFDQDDDVWVGVFYSKGKKSYLQGFIHKSRLLPLEELAGIPEKGAARVEKPNALVLQNDSVTVEVRTAVFTPKVQKIKRDKAGYVVGVDGRWPRGADGNMPWVELKSIRVQLNGKEVAIPASAYNDLFKPGTDSFNVYFDQKGTIFLYMPSNSDSAGYYSVAWVIRNGRYVKRYVDSL